ncbi:MAG: c-type cytochrome biogenesis protein CcmI, partial [Comamonas sp.]|nr:c-type cytochrome biogenesis protein CcmI [Comamonas sp.]
MSAMHWLWLGAIALMLLSLAVLLPPLLAEAPLPASDPDEALRRLYQAQLAELKLERSGGRLSETDHAEAVE